MHVNEICEELNKVEQDISFVVAYSKKNAEPLLVLAGPGCTEKDMGTGRIDLQKIREEVFSKEYAEVKCTTIINTYSSPGCQILTASGNYKCICCG